MAAVFLIMHGSLNGIFKYLFVILIPFFRALTYWLISLEIINDLSEGGLEEDLAFTHYSHSVGISKIWSLLSAISTEDTLATQCMV